jgi:AcrR family transcriptional regulator
MPGATRALNRKPAKTSATNRVERRRNADRSAATRKQILEATIHCLDACGYGAVTNIRVADEAGVSRGAMMHHFPTRQALIVATVEYAYGKLSSYRNAELEKLEPGLPRFRAIIDLATATHQMPEGVACSEIRTGSRSDPEIRAAVTPIMSHISDDYGRLVGRVAREAGLVSNRELQGLTATTVMATRALSINTFTYPREQVLENVLWTLKSMREDIIARQLGERVAKRPEPPAGSRLAPRPRRKP